MVLRSVRKTGRLLVTHEAVAVAGFGAEIAATVAEHAAADLRAPVRRLGQQIGGRGLPALEPGPPQRQQLGVLEGLGGAPHDRVVLLAARLTAGVCVPAPSMWKVPSRRR